MNESRLPAHAVTFRVPGPPLTWKRTNTFDGKRITPKEQRAYQNAIAFAFRSALAPLRWPTDALYRLTVEVTTPTGTMGDWDNYGKNVSDALNRVAYSDDRQVKEGIVRVLAPNKDAPGMRVTIEVIGEAKAKRTMKRRVA